MQGETVDGGLGTWGHRDRLHSRLCTDDDVADNQTLMKSVPLSRRSVSKCRLCFFCVFLSFFLYFSFFLISILPFFVLFFLPYLTPLSLLSSLSLSYGFPHDSVSAPSLPPFCSSILSLYQTAQSLFLSLSPPLSLRFSRSLFVYIFWARLRCK